MKNQWDIDMKNDRIVAYLPNLFQEEVDKLVEMIKKDSPGKVIIYTTDKDSPKLKDCGLSLEAQMSGFFAGNNAYIYTCYLNEERSLSKSSLENIEVLTAVRQDKKDLAICSHDYPISLIKDNEFEDLANLYRKVFPVYPTNVYDPTYLRESKDTNYIFIVAKDKGKIIGAASAMDTGYQSAEITDCAVDPNYRGKNILHFIIMELENALLKRGINNAFSITRAKSVGMNMTVKRLGYHFEGTLTNNCIISSGYEDMNIWTKNLVKNDGC
ncbi:MULTISPECIES: putative beta-lysine N-acetyltransferase [Bacillaceae]|uniref:Beta-lysine N-acetyltransferase n=1 Tax=Evansella alkalicola TaxID=745819 RepID=A0ABS6JNI9_9BACI|nr:MULTISPECIES: putative beta-lysine N-acetyltransferase [Bacillaceae]MBU9720048.1 putative beta-lysine N-acetyltransferase [Bacillus alkalicola]